MDARELYRIERADRVARIRSEVRKMYSIEGLRFKDLSPFFDYLGYELDEDEDGYTIFEPDDHSNPYEFTCMFGVIEFMYLHEGFYETFLGMKEMEGGQ